MAGLTSYSLFELLTTIPHFSVVVDRSRGQASSPVRTTISSSARTCDGVDVRFGE
jgi:hypothetical protein